jgi:hypothetical protein
VSHSLSLIICLNKNRRVLAKTDMKTSGTEQRTHIRSHTTITNLSLTKALKIYDGEKAASSTKTAGKTG